MNQLNDPGFYVVLLGGEARDLQKMLADAGKRTEEDLKAIYSMSTNAAANATTIANWALSQMEKNDV